MTLFSINSNPISFHKTFGFSFQLPLRKMITRKILFFHCAQHRVTLPLLAKTKTQYNTRTICSCAYCAFYLSPPIYQSLSECKRSFDKKPLNIHETIFEKKMFKYMLKYSVKKAVNCTIKTPTYKKNLYWLIFLIYKL